jgi:very-short-patch-repair endonuclease
MTRRVHRFVAMLRPPTLRRRRRSSSRAKLSPPERLKNSQLDGLRFRNQHPIGSYVADFFCEEGELVVEVNGRVHDHVHDEERDRWMNERNVAVLRVAAADVVTDLSGVLELVRRVGRMRRAELGRQHPVPPPPPAGEVSCESSSVTEGVRDGRGVAHPRPA